MMMTMMKMKMKMKMRMMIKRANNLISLMETCRERGKRRKRFHYIRDFYDVCDILCFAFDCYC